MYFENIRVITDRRSYGIIGICALKNDRMAAPVR